MSVLRLFVIRARRVEEHSLSRDQKELLVWAQGKMCVRQYADGSAGLSRSLPPEEALDSLAARCRPFLLKKDAVHHEAVLKSIKFFMEREDLQILQGLASLKLRWKAVSPESEGCLGYWLSLLEADGRNRVMVSDKDLAMAWLYGDLVHADRSRLSAVAGFSLSQRYEATVLFVSQVAVLAMDTLELIRLAVSRGHVPLEGECFTGEVVARAKVELPVVRMALASAGTPLDELADAMADRREDAAGGGDDVETGASGVVSPEEPS